MSVAEIKNRLALPSAHRRRMVAKSYLSHPMVSLYRSPPFAEVHVELFRLARFPKYSATKHGRSGLCDAARTPFPPLPFLSSEAIFQMEYVLY